MRRRSYENESNNYVYFDDLKINYQKSQIVQSNNYYAFGLQTKDSWTRIDSKPNQYLYNAGSELNEATSNYEMMYRSYDPAIGRMSGVDPMVNSFASLTPYNYSFNDPVFWNDPSGAIADGGSPNAGQKKFGEGNGYEDGGGGSSIFINGRLMNPRNNYGQREWADGTDSYAYLEFMSSVNGITSPVGIRIGDKSLKDFERNSNGQYIVKCDYCGGELKRYTDTYTWDGTNLIPTGTTLVFNPMMITLGQMFGGYNTNGGSDGGLNWQGGWEALVRMIVPLGSDIYPSDDFKGIVNGTVPDLPIGPGGAVKVVKYAKTAKKIVVIGEKMTERVIPYAKKIGATWFKANGKNPAYYMRNQVQWIRRQIKDPFTTIIDIGPKGSKISSPWYQKEVNMIMKWLGN